MAKLEGFRTYRSPDRPPLLVVYQITSDRVLNIPQQNNPTFLAKFILRSAKGFGAADQFPVPRVSLMVFKVGSHSEARRMNE